MKNRNQNQQCQKSKFEVELENQIIEQIKIMESYTKISASELVSTAVKRFIAAHKDYFPEN